MPLKEILGRIGIFVIITGFLAFPASPIIAQGLPDHRLGSAIEHRLERITNELFTLRGHPLGLVPLTELVRLDRWSPPTAWIQPLRTVVEDTQTHPLVRSLSAYHLARAFLAAGNLAESDRWIEREGYLTRWSIVGPFPNDGMIGFDTNYGPELSRSSNSSYVGRLGETRWRDVSEFVRLGYIDFAQLAQPAHNAVAYAATELDVPRSGEVRLWTSVDGAYKVWVNGQLVALRETAEGGEAIQEWWDIRLVRGTNHLIIKVAGEEGPLGFHLRLTRPDGQPLPHWSSSSRIVEDLSSLQETGPVGPAGSLQFELESAVLDTWEAPIERSEALAGAAFVLHELQPDDPQEPWRYFVSEQQTCTDGTARALYLCSQVHEPYWQRARALRLSLERMEADDPRYPWVQYELAELQYSGLGEALLHQSEDLTRRILADRPDFVPALVLQGRIFQTEGFYWRASECFSRALTESPDSPEVLHQVQRSLRQAGESPGLLHIYRRQAELEASSTSVYLWLIPALIQAGQVNEALTTLERAIRINPLSPTLYHLQANLLFSLDDIEGAETIRHQVTDLLPGSAAAWEELGRLYIRLGDLESANIMFTRALTIEPQNRDLAEYRSEIQAERDVFYQAFSLDLDAIQELDRSVESADTRDFVYLVDQEINRIHANGLGTAYVQQAFKVQTRLGAEDLRQISIEFTPDSEVIRVLAARIIKPDGSVQESFDSWQESLSQPWYGLYYDVRAMILSFEDLAPGDILEIQYTVSNISSQNLLADYFGDFWYVQDVQPKILARYGVIHPDDMQLSFRRPLIEHTVEHGQISDGVLDLFELRNVPHIEREGNMPGFSSVADYIHTSSFESWATVSSLYWNLIEDQLVTSPEIEQTVAQLVDGLSTTRERVRAIHEYVVRNTRYVGLEFGIHGFRPYRTTICFARRFGDCKDTAALMKVMLAVAGIESHIVLVRTRNRGLVDPYPASLAVFNHAIIYVPQIDLFLDGTTGHAGIDELPSADQGASALVVLDGQAHRFITTPYLPASENRFEYRFDVDLDHPDNPASGSILASGQFAPPIRRRYEAIEQRIGEFQREFGEEYHGARINEIEFIGLDDINRPVEIDFAFTGVSWLRGASDRPLMNPLGVESNLTSRYAGSATRRQSLQIGSPFQLSYHITYTLPSGYEAVLDQTRWVLDSPYGQFQMTLMPEDDRLLVQALLEITAPMVQPADYHRFREFIQNVQQIVNRTIRLEPHENS